MAKALVLQQSFLARTVSVGVIDRVLHVLQKIKSVGHLSLVVVRQSKVVLQFQLVLRGIKYLFFGLKSTIAESNNSVFLINSA